MIYAVAAALRRDLKPVGSQGNRFNLSIIQHPDELIIGNLPVRHLLYLTIHHGKYNEYSYRHCETDNDPPAVLFLLAVIIPAVWSVCIILQFRFLLINLIIIIINVVFP